MSNLNAGKIALAVAAAATMFASLNAPAKAQNLPLVGVWTESVHDAQGKPFAVIVDEFRADGMIHVRMMVTNGITDYVGRYEVASASTITVRFDDYGPKQNCVAVCLPIPPVVPMGVVQTMNVQFPNDYTMVINGEEFHRQM
ncbi:MAG: hypothetical protein JO273_20650 [Methylobacteriaceae bacterium]|nr:hypothetical protein [Methylobacteriaceae bacterium]